MKTAEQKVSVNKGTPVHIYPADLDNTEMQVVESDEQFEVDVHQIKGNWVYFFFGVQLCKVQKHLVMGLLMLLVFVGQSNACSRDVKLLSPELQSKLKLLKEKADEQGIHFEVICTYRDPKEQLDLYEQGRSTPGNKVTWRKSSRHSEGIAVDLAISILGKISWSPDEYRRIGDIGKRIGLVWGGDWKQRDYGHFELPNKELVKK